MAQFSGHFHLRAAARASGQTVLAGQSFRAPYHLSKPYWDADAGTLVVQMVNSTAGILEGDSLEADIAVEANASLLVTTPSASRVFRMRDGSAECRQHFSVEKAGWLEVLPEPLVPHRGCRYRQATRVDVAAGGGVFFADLLFPGRIAHGEAWSWERLCLVTEIRLEGELILRERFDHSGAELKALAVLAGSGTEACFGNAVLVAEGEPPRLSALAALHGDGVWFGVSPLRRGGWNFKFVAPDSIGLRRTLRGLREILAVDYARLGCSARKL